MYSEGLRAAWDLLTGFDPRIFSELRVTLLCSVASTAAAGLAGIPLALLLRRAERGWRRAVLVAARTGMACPTVVVGLLLYGLFSRSGDLGGMGILYTPAAIVAGEFLLALPVIVAFATQGLAALDPRLERTALTLGAGRLRLAVALLREARPALLLFALSVNLVASIARPRAL
jgi:tungstate transport system permease protein